MFIVIIYEDKSGKSPVTEYIDDLDLKALTSKDSRIRLKKIYQYFELLKMYGSRAGLPASKHIEDDIWELRPTNDRFFMHTGKRIHLLSFTIT